MDDEWHHQVRVTLAERWVQAARHDPGSPGLEMLADILGRHQATLVSQLDAFESYLMEVERAGAESSPLYRWTKVVLADPAKRAKHAANFALRADSREVYSKEVADALEAELLPLVGGGVITHVSRHDTNPANNLPIPSEHRA